MTLLRDPDHLPCGHLLLDYRWEGNPRTGEGQYVCGSCGARVGEYEFDEASAMKAASEHWAKAEPGWWDEEGADE